MTTASDIANALSTALLAGTDFDIELPDFSDPNYQFPPVDPNSPLYEAIDRLTTADLTTGATSLTGSGTFDILMKAITAHLKLEFEQGRITGAEYTKAYIASVESAMSTGAQYLSMRDATYWSAVTAQMTARTAEIGVITARVQLESEKTRLQVLTLEAMNAQATYALNKLRLAVENVTYDTGAFNLAEILPQNKQMLLKQIAGQEAQNTNLGKQGLLLDDEHALAPKKEALLDEQIDNQAAQTVNLGKQGTLLDDEHSLQPKKEELMQEQIEVQRAQTLDTRSDAAPITGSIGKQKELYTQQITSYKRDSEVKVAKIFSDAWITQKTIDEGILPPDGFTNASLDEILAKLKENNELEP